LGNGTTFSSSSSVKRTSSGGGGTTADMDGTAGGINPGPSEVLDAGNVISSNGSLDDSFLTSIERNSSVERNSSTS
jgi:hypothetical protein